MGGQVWKITGSEPSKRGDNASKWIARIYEAADAGLPPRNGSAKAREKKKGGTVGWRDGR